MPREKAAKLGNVPALLQALARLVALKRLGGLLFVLAATLCATNTASAFAPAQTKSRVGVFDLANDNSSGLLSAATGGKHQGNRSAPSEVASGSLLAAEGLATESINAPRLADQLIREEASSAFTATGELSPEAIQGSTQIFAPGELGNPAIPEGFGKYTTQTFGSPSGPFQVHFYMEPLSGEIHYGLDYKAIFNNGIQPFRAASGIAP